MAKIGKFILENLTTGMYVDSRICYREYIQNACDQIDKAVKLGILKDKSEGLVDVTIRKSKITIEDNATGIEKEKFSSTLGDIANSDKIRGEDKGFRGIGRLCGIAYCKTLVFTTSFMGEDIKSIMTIDAEKVKQMLYEKEKYTVDYILEQTVTFSYEEEAKDSHYFRVELIDIDDTNEDLTDEKKIKEYLSFVAPVPFKNTFYLRDKIYKYAQNHGFKIDEYCVKINSQPIYKEYTTRLKKKEGNNIKNYDEIFDICFKEIKNNNDKTIAWLWYGMCCFDIQIPDCNNMRGLRVRTGNIQIGNDNVVQKLFKESRGNYYFVGEIYTIDPELIPNSQRDYFNENASRTQLELELKKYFYSELHVVYYHANKLKSALTKQKNYLEKSKEYNENISNGNFINEEDKTKAKINVEKAKEESEKAVTTIKKAIEGTANSNIQEINKKIIEKYKGEDLLSKIENVEVKNEESSKQYVTQSMSKLDRKQRKIVQKIMSIIVDNLEKEKATELIELIKKELV